MNQVLKKVVDSGKCKDENGKMHRVHSGISESEGNAIVQVIREAGFHKSIEIGCAYGVSSLYICEAVSEAPNPRHVAIDPLQSEGWGGCGIANLQRAGYDFAEVIEEPSEIALPRLMEQGEEFDFALIDGMHTFDHALLDFFYINRILRVGGVVAFDDLYLPAINKVVRYVINYPAYEVLDVDGIGKTDRSSLHNGVSQLFGIIPDGVSKKLFNMSIVKTDEELGIKSSMVFLEKVGQDQREWDWFESF